MLRAVVGPSSSIRTSANRSRSWYFALALLTLDAAWCATPLGAGDTG